MVGIPATSTCRRMALRHGAGGGEHPSRGHDRGRDRRATHEASPRRGQLGLRWPAHRGRPPSTPARPSVSALHQAAGRLMAVLVVLFLVLGGGYLAQPPALLHRHQCPGDRDDLPRAAIRPARGHQALRDVYVSGVPGLAGPGRPARLAVQRRSALADQAPRTWYEALELGKVVEVSERNRELLGPDPGLAAGHRRLRRRVHPALERLTNLSLTYGAIFLGLCLAAHVFIRITLPHADPYMFPLVALLASFGIVMVYGIDQTLARQQAQWFVLGLVLFAVTIVDVPRLPQARAIPLPDRRRVAGRCCCCRACRASAIRPTAPTWGCGFPGCSCSSRPSSPRSGWSSSWPATCATPGR